MSFTLAEKHEMIRTCMATARIKVNMAARGQPVEEKELLANVHYEIVRCADRFVDMGVAKFSSYASYRIDGTIFDYIFRRPYTLKEIPFDDVEPLDGSRSDVGFEELLDYLPEREQTCLRLKFLEGYSYRAIGEKLGIHYKAVDRLFQRAFKTIRERLEDAEITDR